ncbi:MAG: hypothetical protein KKB48_00005, partial [Gammaproteobacteria bacterium]|nr:hypothetical protein [Gammaproteobacteria bacterium]
ACVFHRGRFSPPRSRAEPYTRLDYGVNNSGIALMGDKLNDKVWLAAGLAEFSRVRSRAAIACL